MTAAVEPSIHEYWFVAWCDTCPGGYGGGKIAARNWAYLHNENHHNGEGN